MEVNKQDLQNFVFDFNDKIVAKLEKAGFERNNYNVFDILNINRQELRHSDFLAFLLNPQKSGYVGEQFLRQFLVALAKDYFDTQLDFFDLFYGNFKNVVVRREYQNIDILVDAAIADKNILLVIENKIDSGEQLYDDKKEAGQLEKYKQIARCEYRNHIPLFLFLSPDRRPPSDDDWTAIDYGLIYDTLCKIDIGAADNTVKTLLTDYKKMIRSQFNMDADKELQDIAVQIYTNNKDIFDFIFNNRPNRINTTAKVIRECLDSVDFVRFDKEKYKRQNVNIVFTTNELYDICKSIYFQFSVDEMLLWAYIVDATPEEKRALDIKTDVRVKRLASIYLLDNKNKRENADCIMRHEDLLLNNQPEEVKKELDAILQKFFAPDGWVAQYSKQFCELLRK